MKRKICVKSMVLGAGIMLIGLTIGAIVSPPLIAQRNDAFDIITCRKLVVVDDNSNKTVQLGTSVEGHGAIVLYNKHGEETVILNTFKDSDGGAVILSNRHGESTISLGSSEVIDRQTGVVRLVNLLEVHDPQNPDITGIKMRARSDGRRLVQLYDKEEEIGVELSIVSGSNQVVVANPQSSNAAIKLESHGNTNSVGIYNPPDDKPAELAILLGAVGSDTSNPWDLPKIKRNGNLLIVRGKAGAESISLGGFEGHEPTIGIVDRAGDARWSVP